MRKFIFTFFLLLSCLVLSQQTKKVFFIGNSYTATGNIPYLVEKIAEGSDDELIYTAHTPGGATLKQHSSNSFVISTIEQGDWDFVVLQEQSQLPSFSMETVETEVLPYAEQLSDMIKQNNHCAQVAFYMTWGRENGDSQYCQYWPPVCTYEGMDDLLYERYMLMAELNDAVISPVGKVWRYIRENYPTTGLYSSDGSHPSAIGSMAAAYTFYTVIFKKSPYESDYNGNVSVENMDIIREAVNETVYQNMDEWHLWDYMPHSEFEYSNQELEVSFENLSTYAENYYWDFGDGEFSDEEKPVHLYGEPGVYTVKLKAEKCDNDNIIEKTIDLSGLNTVELDEYNIHIYPNPAESQLYINTKEEIITIDIFRINGNKVNASKTSKNQLDIQNLSPGIYFLKIETPKAVRVLKFTKK